MDENPLRYAGRVNVSKAWTDEAVLAESGRWVYVPPEGVLVQDERRMLVHLPEPLSTSRV